MADRSVCIGLDGHNCEHKCVTAVSVSPSESLMAPTVDPKTAEGQHVVLSGGEDYTGERLLSLF